MGPRRSYGARYLKLITSWLIIPRDTFLARPKSHIFRYPSLEYSKLDVFRSLWTIFRWWRCSIPFNRSSIILLTWDSSNLTTFMNYFSSCSIYSITMKTLSCSVLPMTCLIWMIFWCLIDLKMAIYRNDVIGKSDPSINFNFFIANTYLVRGSWALYTTPYVP